MDVPAAEPNEFVATIVEIALLLIGVFVLVRWQFSPRSRDRKVTRLAPWSISISEFLIRALAAVVGALVAQGITAALQRQFPTRLTDDTWLIVQGSAFQLGVLGGVLLASARAKTGPSIELDTPPLADASLDPPVPVDSVPTALVLPGKMAINPFLGGLLTFLAALPLVMTVGFLWQSLLKWGDFPIEQQEMIDLLTSTDSPAVVIGMAILAVVIAPLMEETLFRAGLFRYLRTRIPRFSALIISAVLFSALHANVAAFAPLVVFGVVLAIAYERTGRIEIPMVAHALFNLHTLVLLLAGVNA